MAQPGDWKTRYPNIYPKRGTYKCCRSLVKLALRGGGLAKPKGILCTLYSLYQYPSYLQGVCLQRLSCPTQANSPPIRTQKFSFLQVSVHKIQISSGPSSSPPQTRPASQHPRAHYRLRRAIPALRRVHCTAPGPRPRRLRVSRKNMPADPSHLNGKPCG